MGNKLRQELLHKCAPVTEVYGRARHTAIVFGTSHICIEMIMKEYQELVLVLLDKYGKRETWYRIDYKYEIFFKSHFYSTLLPWSSGWYTYCLPSLFSLKQPWEVDEVGDANWPNVTQEAPWPTGNFNLDISSQSTTLKPPWNCFILWDNFNSLVAVWDIFYHVKSFKMRSCQGLNQRPFYLVMLWRTSELVAQLTQSIPFIHKDKFLKRALGDPKSCFPSQLFL